MARLLIIIFSFYLFVRGWQALPKIPLLQIIYSILFLVPGVTFYSAYFLSALFPVKIALVMRQIAGFWIIFFVCSLLAALFADFLRVMHHFWSIYPQWVIQHYSSVKLTYIGVGILTVLILTLAGFKNFVDPQVVKLNLRIDKQITDHNEITIVAASDFHLGNIIGKERLAEWVEMINMQNPDIILLAGDIFDRNFSSFLSHEVDDELMKLNARQGVYAVLGNHEYFTDTKEAIRCLNRCNITLLIDSVITLKNKVIIAGRDDPCNPGRKSMDSLLYGINSDLPLILLDHQPYSLNESVKHKVDLYIAGHLHNGQIYPLNVFLSRYWELYYGYRKIGNTHFYVTSGLGLRIVSIRLGTRSEIVLIRLKTTQELLQN